jgi:hypothetical protein
MGELGNLNHNWIPDTIESSLLENLGLQVGM